ncbi:MAG: hypothetical protein RIF41_34190 [Polyangiaceae bacterium]
MKRRFLILALIIGCQADETDAERPADFLSCSFYYRASNVLEPGQDPDDPALQHVEEVLVVRPNEEASATLGDLTVSGSFFSSEHDGASFSLAVVRDGNAPLFASLYQFGHGSTPENQFHGQHGFTGLIYLTHPENGGDYQLICGAGDY